MNIQLDPHDFSPIIESTIDVTIRRLRNERPTVSTGKLLDWARQEITVISPKTAHHPGKGQRTVPLFPELVRPLMGAFEQAPDGAVYVVTKHRSQADGPDGWRNCNLRTSFEKIVRRAGVRAVAEDVPCHAQAWRLI